MSFKRQHIELLDKIVIGRAIFQPPFRINAALENEARFLHVINGRSTMYAPIDQVRLTNDDSLFMSCDNVVNNWLENEDGSLNEVIVIQFYPEIIQYVYDGLIPDFFSVKQKIKSRPVEKIAPNAMISNYAQSLRFYFDNPGYMTDDLTRLKIKELILILVSTDPSGRIKTILSDLFKSNEYEFRDIIHSNLYEDMSIQDLAFFAGLSLSSFKRKFKNVFGTSPAQYIKSKRLEKAKSLLEKTDLRITEIAFDCGFNDVGHFSKSFQSAFQVTPSEYRKNNVDQFSN
ncbi:MAG: AraC family transcriptional regulator [Bacteroidota bacterium]